MKQVLFALIVAGMAAVPAGLLIAAQAGQDRPLDPVVVAWDNGSDTIDVSKYPPEIKRKYRIFADLCARCHTLARAINCDFALEDDWERYIKRMMRRGRNMIKPDQAQQIFEFAVYDSKVRKKELYDYKLAAAGR